MKREGKGNCKWIIDRESVSRKIVTDCGKEKFILTPDLTDYIVCPYCTAKIDNKEIKDRIKEVWK